MPAPQHSSFFTDLMRILPPKQQHLMQRFEAVFGGIACIEQMQSTGWAKKWVHRLMATILSNLYRFKKVFSMEDSFVSL